MARYIPDRGDIIWLSFNPQAGHEQSGHRPGVVLSPKIYNRQAGLALICPITSQVKGYPFEVKLPEGLPVEGVVLADQVRSLDWLARNARRAGVLPHNYIEEILAKIKTLL